MPTATAIIKRSLQHLGVVEGNNDPAGDDLQTMVEMLRSLLDAWQITPNAITGTDTLTHTPVAGTQSFTIGPAGAVIARQPLRIERASFWRRDGIDTPLDVRTLAEYNAEPSKATQGQPEYVALDRGGNAATAYLWPAADGVSQLHLVVASDVVASFDTITGPTNLALPAGMQNALEWSLAEEATAIYQADAETAARCARNAAKARRLLSRSNTKRSVLSLPVGRLYDINTD